MINIYSPFREKKKKSCAGFILTPPSQNSYHQRESPSGMAVITCNANTFQPYFKYYDYAGSSSNSDFIFFPSLNFSKFKNKNKK